jgi:pSer/pThr/pTyr-binding forkhead associated (FHA) protein
MLLATNYAAIVRPLQLLVMVIAGLFFLRVMRFAAVQTRPVDAEPRRRRSAPLALSFIEPVEREGERIDIENPVVIGRGEGCDLRLSDTYLSSRHARVSLDGNDLEIEDLQSTNGTYINQELVSGRRRLERGDIVQVGGVLFEVVR